ncbi:transcriptional regulator [Ahniella affigens]|uniref:Transcriptional regulator n=1 Tax=Ahniella affigens TaxID=2021234 RepID=A0A2P1PY98_9GAMM|nr:sigma-54 dependent transcriptional regulator [Ahniella affigens]AVP99794.1 transcriptional regulator [Ahniella affigens]
MTGAHILVVDDEPDIRGMIEEILRDEGHRVTAAGDLAGLNQALASGRPDVLLLDVWLPDGDGVAWLRDRQAAGGLACPVLMISGHGTIETAVEAVKHGAYDFLEKPVSLAKLLHGVNRALDLAKLRRENEGLRKQVALDAPVGDSFAMRTLRAQLERAAASDLPVLIRGEVGTGKETLARFVHAASSRAANAFVRFAAASLPPEQQRVALFGAEMDSVIKPGVLDQAQGGTLYLDELMALGEEVQARLSKALEAGQFLRDGGSRPQNINFRLIASSSRALERELQAGQLREDLYYQLNVLQASAPPLRDRLDDIPVLVRYLVDLMGRRDQLPERRFTDAALQELRKHQWPANLRELRNLLQRVLILGQGDVEVEEVQAALGLLVPNGQAKASNEAPIDLGVSLRDARDQFERLYLMRQMKRCGGSMSKLAASAGMERTHLYRKFKDLGIDPKAMDLDETAG